jgi:hypothetical protein
MRWFLDIAAAKYGNALYGQPPMPRRDQRMLLIAAAGTLAALLLAALLGDIELVAYLVPLLALGAPLVAGRYLGEEALERLREARRPRPSRAARSQPATARRTAAAFPRGGRLIAQSLAERGPPLPALT